MGNRGILHDSERKLVRDWQVRRWIACRLEFRGRHRAVMTPGHYTELFFLDEAAALADGHRPCAECRHADFRAFQRAWRGIHPDHSWSAQDIDRVLHSERRVRPFLKRTQSVQIDTLPDGSYVMLDGRAWLVLGDAVWAVERAEVRRACPASIRNRSLAADASVDCRGAARGLPAVLAPVMSIKSLDSSTPDCFVLLSQVDTRQLRWRTTPAGRESGVTATRVAAFTSTGMHLVSACCTFRLTEN